MAPVGREESTEVGIVAIVLLSMLGLTAVALCIMFWKLSEDTLGPLDGGDVAIIWLFRLAGSLTLGFILAALLTAILGKTPL